MGSTLLFAPALLKVSPGPSWAQPPLAPSSLWHRSIPCCAGWAGAGGTAPEQEETGFLLLLSLHRSRAGEGQIGTMFFHMWEHVRWHVLHLTLGEVVFLPNCQSLTPLHQVPARLCWWDRDPPPAAHHAPAQSYPHPVSHGRARVAPCVYRRSGNPRTAFLSVPGGNPRPLHCRFLLQQDPDPSTAELTASPLMSEPNVHAGVGPRLACTRRGDLWGVAGCSVLSSSGLSCSDGARAWLRGCHGSGGFGTHCHHPTASSCAD